MLQTNMTFQKPEKDHNYNMDVIYKKHSKK